MIKLKFKVDDVIKKVQKMITLSGDLRPVLLKIRGTSLSTDTMTIIGGITAQFLNRGSFYGSAWADLSPVYGAWKAKKYPGMTILRRTDRLIKAVAVQNSDGNVEILENQRITWGVSSEDIPYAAYHMAGTSKMKQRKFLGVTESQKGQWATLIGNYIREVQA